MFRGVNPPGVTLIRCRLHVIFSSKLSSLSLAHSSFTASSFNGALKSMCRGVIAGGFCSKFVASANGVVTCSAGCSSITVAFLGLEDVDFVDCSVVFFLGDRGILPCSYILSFPSVPG